MTKPIPAQKTEIERDAMVDEYYMLWFQRWLPQALPESAMRDRVLTILQQQMYSRVID